MTTKAELQKQIDEFKAKLDAMPDDKPKSKGRWKPGICEKYWVVSESTGVFSPYWENSSTDNHLFALANFYHTKEEAQAALDQKLATVRVLDRIAELNAEQGWVCDWNKPGQQKYIVSYDHVTRSFCTNVYVLQEMDLPTSYHGSKQTIETVIKEMESDCLLMLGVSGVAE